MNLTRTSLLTGITVIQPMRKGWFIAWILLFSSKIFSSYCFHRPHDIDVRRNSDSDRKFRDSSSASSNMFGSQSIDDVSLHILFGT